VSGEKAPHNKGGKRPGAQNDNFQLAVRDACRSPAPVGDWYTMTTIENYDLKGTLSALFGFFSSMSPALRTELIDQSKVRETPKGMPLSTPEGDSLTYPLLLNGTVRVSMAGESGREILLYRVSPGQGCTLSASMLFGKEPTRARRMAETRVETLQIPLDMLRKLMREHEPFRDFILGSFTERLGDMVQLVEAVAFHKLDRRLATLLLAKGKVTRATHEELARELGSVREIVSRLLRNFAQQGIVTVRREYVEILDPRALSKISKGLDSSRDSS
jgi:CRP/FNR family transcriptional regulator, anaerobic regulatory protein